MNRAFSLLSIKEVDEHKRTITGIASTPTVDRLGDSVDPLGAKFKTPMPLLLFHQSDKPVGTVDFAKPKKDGIPFTATLPNVTEPGLLQDRVNEAWHSIKYKLLAAVSIGFRPLEDGVELMKNGGLRFKAWEWLELSLVSVPAQPEAVIQGFKSMDANRILSALGERRADDSAERTALIKSLDSALLAASGRKDSSGSNNRPGVPGSRNSDARPKEATSKMKTINDQISDLEAKRDSLAEQMKGFGDVTALDDTKTAEYDAVAGDFEKAEGSLKRLQQMQRAMGEATFVRAATHEEGQRSRAGQYDALGAARDNTPKLEPGRLFARAVISLMAGRGSISDAIEHSKKWHNFFGTSTPEVTQYIRATGGTAAPNSPGWGSELVHQNNLSGQFFEYLYPTTIIGRINGFRRVPFNVRMAAQTGTATVAWVGENAVKPASELDFAEITLGWAKIAGIVWFSEELSRLSDPNVDLIVRNDLARAIRQFEDAQFITPSISPTPVRPGAINYDLDTSITASGADGEALEADLRLALTPMLAANIDGPLVFVMNTSLAIGISLIRNSLGQLMFPTMNASGGTLLGYQVIVSNSSPSGLITIIAPGEILLAEDPSVRVDISREATIDTANGTTATYSFWQRNQIGVRAELFVNYKRGRELAVAAITGATYGPVQTS